MNTNKLRALLQALTEGPVSLLAFKWQIGASQNDINFMLKQGWISLGKTQTGVWVGVTPQGFRRLGQLDNLNLSALISQEAV